jgi:hypothetical protein
MDITVFPGGRYAIGGIVVVAVVILEFLIAGLAHVFLVEEDTEGRRCLVGALHIRHRVRNLSQYYSVRLFLSGIVVLLVLVIVSVPITLQAGSVSDREDIERRIANYVLDLHRTTDEGILRQHVFWGVEDAELARARLVVQDGNYRLMAIEEIELSYDRASVRVQLMGDNGGLREEIFDCQRDPDGWRLRSTGFLD